jgi:hypothetical protein
MKEKPKKWMQTASKAMEKAGTKGSFREIAKREGGMGKDGKIKAAFIEKETKSKNPAIRKKANFAKNVRGR